MASLTLAQEQRELRLQRRERARRATETVEQSGPDWQGDESKESSSDRRTGASVSTALTCRGNNGTKKGQIGKTASQ